MSKEKLQTYPSEFRESSVILALESEQPITHTARDLGINPNTLHTWIKSNQNEYSVAPMSHAD